MSIVWAPEKQCFFFLKVCFILNVMLDISTYTFPVTQFYITYSNSDISILYILELFFSNITTTTAETICNSCKKTKKIVSWFAMQHANKAFHAYGRYIRLPEESGRNIFPS